MAFFREIYKHSNRLKWLSLFLWIILQLFLFNAYIAHEIVDYYPDKYDQAVYLFNIYTLFEQINYKGMLTVLWNGAIPASTLFSIQAVLALKLFGVSRFSVLWVNFIYFIALQLCVLYTVKSLTRNRNYMLLAMGMLLLANAPFMNCGGGLFDVRMDFIAFCLYGIFVCLVMKSEIFLVRKWTLLAIIVASLCILMRTITLVYYVGILGVLLGYFFYKQKSLASDASSDQAVRFKNIFLCLFFIAVVSVIIVACNFAGLYEYYVIGHVLGNEKIIRLAEAGIHNKFFEYFYYPFIFVRFPLGQEAAMVWFGIAVIYLCWNAILPKKCVDEKRILPFKPRLGFLFLILSISIPLFILTMDTSKSAVVSNVVIVPLIWLIVWYGCYVEEQVQLSGSIKRFINWGVLILVMVGIANQIHEYRRFYSKYQKGSLTTLTRMYLDIGNYADAKRWPTVTISADYMCDYLAYLAIGDLYYEKTGKLLPVASTKLGATLYAIKQEEIDDALKKTNVLILGMDSQSYGSPFPFNQTIISYKPFLLKYANTHYKVLGDYELYSHRYRVYVLAN